MVLHNIDIGPTLPFISNIELVELTPDGEMVYINLLCYVVNIII